ncbi:hypothetical protein VPH35_096613 [Triticum aestivum]|uniref:uncharacterized protein isoform X2 n=1 Tax=Triticum aestivum TaxID=4565 RepID=UPI00098A10EF|nr:uncharacterized protein LOC109741177 isoform X2 [Aegilops tauschii subsp. strangulata]XP_044395917.1 uncharacterized protein LOC123119995 isoform X2 [Triticum aestivum]
MYRANVQYILSVFRGRFGLKIDLVVHVVWCDQEYLICAMTIWPCCSQAVLGSMVLRFGSCGECIWRGRKQQGSAERLLRSTEQQEQGARDGSGRAPTTITELDRGAL